MKIFLILLAIFYSSLVVASEEWTWVKATSLGGGWEVANGKAEVEIGKDSFVAHLYWNEWPDKVKYTLEGTIANGKIKATETVHDSDFSGSTYIGTYNKKTWTGVADSTGAESITLSDGWGMIGINRKLNNKHNNALKGDAAEGGAP
jgi:hypothetical protein